MDQDIYRKSGDLRSLADIRLVVLDDGPGRGQRILIARNNAGISFEIAVDRSFDLSQISKQGVNLGWHSPNQMRFPPVTADTDGGWGFLQNFDGFLVTCGLDHYGSPVDFNGETYRHPHRQMLTQPLHGKVASLQGRLHGYGVDAEKGVIWCQGTVRQTAVFGEVLQLDRYIELPIDGNIMTLKDTVSNKGFHPTPHALLYHFNIGYPLLDKELTISGVPTEFENEFHKNPPVPTNNDRAEIVNVLRPITQEDGWSRVCVENPCLAQFNDSRTQNPQRRGIEFSFRPDELPELTFWRCYQSGLFALGIEPGTGASIRDGVAASGQLLAPGEARSYHIALRLF